MRTRVVGTVLQRWAQLRLKGGGALLPLLCFLVLLQPPPVPHLPGLASTFPHKAKAPREDGLFILVHIFIVSSWTGA